LGVALRAVVPASTIALSWTATPDTYAADYTLVRTDTDASTRSSTISSRTTTSTSDTRPSRSTGYTYTLRAQSGTWLSASDLASVAAC
jgi:hypothetical protein